MSRHFLYAAAALASLPLLAASLCAEDAPARKRTVRIAGSWNLTAEKHDKTDMDGERTRILTCTGSPTLKKGRNMIRGPWEVDAKADTIVCDFDGKKFVLTGNPTFQRLDPKGNIVSAIVGQKETIIEVTFVDAKTTVKGPSKTFPVEAPAPTEGK